MGWFSSYQVVRLSSYQARPLVQVYWWAAPLEMSRNRANSLFEIGLNLFLQVIKIILHRPLVRARNAFLAESALGVGLGGGRGLGVVHLALAFNADSF